MYKPDGSPDGIALFTYDAKGNLAKEDRETYSHQYTYKYDLYGNWVERQEFVTQVRKGKVTSEPNLTMFRVITYYGKQKP